MISRDIARCTALVSLSVLLFFTQGAAQDVPASRDSSLAYARFRKFETCRKDKGSALALAILVPGGSVFYAGNQPKYAAGIGLIETSVLGGIVYLLHQDAIGAGAAGDRGMTTALVLIYGVCKILEVSHAFVLIDRHNTELWQQLFGGPREPADGHGPPIGTGGAPDLRFTARYTF